METPTSRMRSLASTNRFAFSCPIFNTNVELRGCVKLHELHMVARGPETRRGCQAAMSSAKCPVPHMVAMMRQGRDEWHAATPTVGTLGADVINRVARVLTREATITEYEVPAREAELLREANGMWEQAQATKGRGAGKAKPAQSVALPDVEAPEPPISSNDEVTKAASRGDLGAALTAAARAENAPASTKATPTRKPRSRAA